MLTFVLKNDNCRAEININVYVLYANGETFKMENEIKDEYKSVS